MMNPFKKAANKNDRIVLQIDAEGITAARIKRTASALPKVDLLQFIPVGASTLNARLEKLAKELGSKRYRWSTLLNAGDYQLIMVEAPEVDADELRAALRWRIKDLIDFSIDEATIDVIDVPLHKDVANRVLSMFAVVARNQAISMRQKEFAEAGLSLNVIDIPEMAQRNFSVLLEPEKRGIALLSFDGSGGLLTVTFGGYLYLSRRIDVTAEQLTNQDVARRSAFYDRITLEVQRSLDHCDRQFHFIPISKLMLAPLADAAVGLRDYLSNSLYLPVESLDLSRLLDLSGVPELQSAEAHQRFFLALGAALRIDEAAS